MKTVRGSAIIAQAPFWVPLVCLACLAVVAVALLFGLSPHIQVHWLPLQSSGPAQACGGIPFPCAPSRIS